MESEHRFVCFDDCDRCCTNETAPISLTIGDMARISKHKDITIEELFKKYCHIDGIEVASIYYNIFPSIGLKLPCKFLENGKCTIYNYRPLFCRVFPEDLILNPLYDEEKQMYIDMGYECVIKGFKVDDDHKKVIEKLVKIMDKEIEATGEYFYLYDYDSKFSEEDITLFKDMTEKAKTQDDMFAVKKIRTETARERIKAVAEKAILKSIKKLSNKKDLEEYDLLK
ncbi:MAG: YkgJ family cysteine cluster protein [Candidatus Hydrothermarchaeales archaeon]